MNYKLAKELKDAGWNDKNVSNIIIGGEDQAYKPPTLSELIDACGEEFVEISKGTKPVDYDWIAQARREDGNNPFTVGYGKTPEEAVSKLWIKLNS